MAEEAGTEEKETSTMGRVKDRIKQLTGRDSEEEKHTDGQPEGSSEEDGGSGEQPEAQAEGQSGEAEGESQDAEGQGESQDAEGQGESQDAEGKGDSQSHVGDYSVDDVDLDKKAEDEDEARAQIKKLEKEGPPENLADWPTGKGMFLTFGGAEGDEGYEDGTARQMGPSSLRHHADGSVEVQGETVDNPEDYKAEKSVTEEADELGVDKGAKTEDDGSEGEESSDDGAQAEGSDESSAQGEGSDESSAQSEGSSQGDGSGSEASEEKSESEAAETN